MLKKNLLKFSGFLIWKFLKLVKHPAELPNWESIIKMHSVVINPLLLSDESNKFLSSTIKFNYTLALCYNKKMFASLEKFVFK